MKEKILYFECKTGAAGDMLIGALYELLSGEEKKEFLNKVNSISDEIQVIPETKNVRGIGGTHMRVEIRGREEEEYLHEETHSHMNESGAVHEHEHGEVHTYEHEHGEVHTHEHEHGEVHTHEHEHGEVRTHEHEHGEVHTHEHMHGEVHTHEHEHAHAHGHHAHTSCPAILKKISELDLEDRIKAHASDVYRVIAAAEGKVHQTDMQQIHFHEVGSLDALVDVAGCCIAIDLLKVDKIQCSPICVGNGTVRCAHGILPVPAPATAEIIKGMPIYTSSFDGELLTPTGAAVLKHFVRDFTKEMNMEIENIGYGFGTKEFEQLSCVRAFLGYK